MRLALVGALGLLLLGAGATAVAQPWTPAPSEAEIDRFMAALPDLRSMTRASQNREPAWAASFFARNARRGAEAGLLVRIYVACVEPAQRAAVIRGLRRVAHDLGAERLARMTRFYAEGHQARFALLADPSRPERSAEAAELREMLRDYPVEDFARVMLATMQALFSDPQLRSEIRPCRDALLSEASRRGLAFPRRLDE